MNESTHGSHEDWWNVRVVYSTVSKVRTCVSSKSNLPFFSSPEKTMEDINSSKESKKRGFFFLSIQCLSLGTSVIRESHSFLGNHFFSFPSFLVDALFSFYPWVSQQQYFVMSVMSDRTSTSLSWLLLFSCKFFFVNSNSRKVYLDCFSCCSQTRKLLKPLHLQKLQIPVFLSSRFSFFILCLFESERFNTSFLT